jgi:hypothetical protein
VQIVEWQELLQEAGLSGVVEQMLAALQRDGCVVLSGAVPTDVCDAIEAEIAPYKWRSRSDGRTEGITGSLLSRSRFVQHMAAHPAVIAVVEAVLGRQVLYPELMELLSNSKTGPGSPGGRLPWRVHVDITIPKDANQPAQQLHRDGDLSLLDFANEMEHAVSVIWYASFICMMLISVSHHTYGQHRFGCHVGRWTVTSQTTAGRQGSCLEADTGQ